MDKYDPAAVAAINKLIADNGLRATPDAPITWNFASWNNDTPRQIVKLRLSWENMTGEASFAGLTTLQGLYCDNNNLTGLDVANCVGLQKFNCANNKLSKLNVTCCSALQELFCHENNLSELDVSKCPELQELYCNANNLSELDVTKCTQLESLHCNDNNIVEVDVSKCTVLEDFYNSIVENITKIVLTGGPCAGKTTALSRIIEKFTDKGYFVLALPEAASLFNQAGVNFLTDDRRLFAASEKALLAFQTSMEEHFVRIAAAAARPALIVCDRGTMDIAAYMPQEDWNALIDDAGLSVVELRDKRYDAVVHMTTAAKGAEQFYTTANNASRTEDAEKARILDDKLIAAWTGHPHLRIADNASGFDGKINRVIAEISAVLGIPEPIETERKYVVEITGDLPANSVETEIFQTYLMPDGNEEVRLRKRGQNGHYIYFLTRKRALHGANRVETERQITATEYAQLLAQADPERTTIHKRRTCFVWENQYFELDAFVNPILPFSLLEIEDAQNHEDIKFPPCVRILEDVTDNKEYYNSNLARNNQQSKIKNRKVCN